MMAAAAVLAATLLQADSTWVHQGVHVQTFDDGNRWIEWELVVPATMEEMWAAWTDPEAIATWAGPAAAVDLRIGGEWHVYFDPDAAPGERGSDANTVLGLVPGRELRIEAGAPREFPTVRAEKTEFIVRLDPVGFGHVRVHVVQAGWKRGDEWDRAFRTMAHANAEWLSWLHRRFTQGPIDWSRKMGDLETPAPPETP